MYNDVSETKHITAIMSRRNVLARNVLAFSCLPLIKISLFHVISFICTCEHKVSSGHLTLHDRCSVNVILNLCLYFNYI